MTQTLATTFAVLAAMAVGWTAHGAFNTAPQPEVTDRAEIECELGRSLQVIHDGGTKATLVCNHE